MLTLWIVFLLYFHDHHVKAQPRLVTTAITTKPPYNSIGLLWVECYNTASSKKRLSFLGTGTIINSGLEETKTYDYILTAASNIWRVKSKPNELCDNFLFCAGLNQPITVDRNSLKVSLATHRPEDIDRIWMQEYILSPKPETNYAIIKWYRHSSATATLKPLTINVRKAVSGSGEIAAYDTTSKTGALTTKRGRVRFTPAGNKLFVQSSTKDKKKLLLPTDAIGGPLVTKKKLIGICIAVGKTENKFLRIDKTMADHINKVISKTLDNEFTFSGIDVARFGVDYVEWGKQVKPVKQELMSKYPFKATGLLVHHCSLAEKRYMELTPPRPKPRPRPEAVGVGSIIKSIKESDGNVYDYILTVGHNVWVTGKAFGTGAPAPKEQQCDKYEFYLGLNQKDIFMKSDWDTKRATLMTHDSAGVQEIYLPYFDGKQRGKVGENFDDEKYYDWAVIKWKKKVNRVSDVLEPTYYKEWQKTYGKGTPLKTLIATYDPFNGRPPRDYDPFGWGYRAKTRTVEVRVQSSMSRIVLSRIWIHKLREMFARPGMSGSPLVLIDDKPSPEGSRKQIGILAAVDKRTKGEAKYVRITEKYHKDIMDILDGKRKPDLAHEDIENYYEEGEMMDDSAVEIIETNDIPTLNGENDGLYEKWMYLELIIMSALIICCGCMGFGCGLLSMYAFKIVNK